jgi:precorrin-2 dehydrogenase/sirohydrochlorin ferrochelatase
MDTFPAFFPLKGKRVVIAGDGEPAAAKARLFEGAPAEIVRLEGEAALDPTAYEGATLIFVASYDEAFARKAASAARTSGAPLNVVDRPQLSDFHTPAIVDRGAVVAAIGTAGAAPLLASLLRAEVEIRVPPSLGPLAALLGQRREALRAAFPDLVQRRAFLRSVLAGPIAQAATKGDKALSADQLDAAIAKGGSSVGRVTFIQRPGEEDLISLRAVRALNIADVVVAGPEGRALLASHARRDAEHLKPDEAGADVLASLVGAGRLVAIVEDDIDQALAGDLIGRGLAVDQVGSFG